MVFIVNIIKKILISQNRIMCVLIALYLHCDSTKKIHKHTYGSKSRFVLLHSKYKVICYKLLQFG